MWCTWLGLAWASIASADFTYTEQYAAKRSDYYLRRATLTDGQTCSQLLQAAIDVSPNNKTVADIVAKAGCKVPGKPLGEPSFQVGPMSSWASEGLPKSKCPVPTGSKVVDIFPTPIGFTHVSDLGLKDWRKMLSHLRDASIKRFQKIVQQAKKKHSQSEDANFIHINNAFFKKQITAPDQAMAEKRAWPEMYGSQAYRDLAKGAKNICSSYARKLGISLSAYEEKQMGIVLWTAVYPEMKDARRDPVTHFFHAHQESIISFVIYASVPEPTTPLTVGDPRGVPPIEDFEYFQNLGDLGVDGEPPFHRGLEFFAGDGDVLIFPSWAIHKVPPHIGKGTRVVWPVNCELPRRESGRGIENPLDGWQRTSFWPSAGLPGPAGARPDSVGSYLAHANAALLEADVAQDPYMKLWEVQNQVVAMVQFDPQNATVLMHAGNVATNAARLLAAREEGDYFPDAAVFLARALHLDPAASKDALKTLYGKLKNKKQAKRLHGMVQKTDPGKEFIQFLHADINGPDKCKSMCNASSEPAVPRLLIAGLFGTRVVVKPISMGQSMVDDIEKTAKEILGGVDGKLKFKTQFFDCWQRDKSASLAGVICAGAASVWFADPRGVWPEKQFAGTVPSGFSSWPSLLEESCPGLDALGREPKAPFHYHHVVQCSAGEVVLFPGWLAFQMSPESKANVRPFTIQVPVGGGADDVGGQTTVGWHLPLVQPHCVAPEAEVQRRLASDENRQEL